MAFSNQDIQNVWTKGSLVVGNNISNWRKDQCGAWINRTSYGNRASQYGWEIDHVDTNTNNNILFNLRPLQWKNNASRQDRVLTCAVTASGLNNIEK